ncbi:MAG: hypothetical protein KC422_25980 [Trueperaceae bacterium]|nr:hypothetical protein [Trueperaceae bacterium]
MKFSWRYTFLLITIIALGIWASAVTIPNSFSAGEVISSSAVNENFSTLATAVTANETALSDLESRLLRFGSAGFQETTFDNEVELASGFAALGSVSLPVVSNVNVVLNAHVYLEKVRGGSHRYELILVNGDCSSTNILGRTLWRPDNSGDTGSFYADTLTLTGFDAGVTGPATYTFCGSDFDGGVSATATLRGLTAVWTPAD